ncbi:MAG: helix-turn-helix transcriptional regulator [Crocinitomicaceae bacterium]|jgi:transcriptional regulator with XRE-family HTH domain|nr:helix-turn-helix transcriptional regulator [Crocinitomicaceae bacterium]
MDKSEFNKRLGLLIRKKRIEKGLTQLELADLMNLDYQYISRIERGLISPTLFWVTKLSEALHIHSSDFIHEFEETID